MGDALGFEPDVAVRCREFRIGCIGAGFIMADVQIPAYLAAGYSVAAIASRTEAHARAVAERHGIATVHMPHQAVSDWHVDLRIVGLNRVLLSF